MKTVVSVLMVIVMTMAVACNGASVNSNPSTSLPTDSASVSDSTLVTERQPMDSVAK